MIFTSQEDTRSLLLVDRNTALVFLEDRKGRIAYVVAENDRNTGRVGVPMSVINVSRSAFVITFCLSYQKKKASLDEAVATSMEDYLLRRQALGVEIPEAVPQYQEYKVQRTPDRVKRRVIAYKEPAIGFFCG